MIQEKLSRIQASINVPKAQYNSFGNYYYRTYADILMAVKPFLESENVVLTLSDEILQAGDRFYVKSTASMADAQDGSSVSVSAFAREAETKKGMDAAQITGSASSYARKCALEGLLVLDNSKSERSWNSVNEQSGSAPARQYITADQRKNLFSLAKQNGKSETQLKNYLEKKYKISKSSMLPAKDYGDVCRWIEA